MSKTQIKNDEPLIAFIFNEEPKKAQERFSTQ